MLGLPRADSSPRKQLSLKEALMFFADIAGVITSNSSPTRRKGFPVLIDLWKPPWYPSLVGIV